MINKLSIFGTVIAMLKGYYQAFYTKNQVTGTLS